MFHFLVGALLFSDSFLVLAAWGKIIVDNHKMKYSFLKSRSLSIYGKMSVFEDVSLQ